MNQKNLTILIILIKGQTTQTLPTAANLTTQVIASDGVSQVKLAYSVNFDNGKGSGTITGIGSDIQSARSVYSRRQLHQRNR